MNREQTKLMITDVIQRVGVRVVLEAVEEWARLNSDMGYDGDDVVWSVVRPRTGGKKVEANRWGPKPPKSGEAVIPPLADVVPVNQEL